MNYAIILAGGIGSRFWPLSNKSLPKQFFNITSKEALFRQTIKRLDKVVSRRNTYVATNKAYKHLILKHIRGLNIPKENLLFEPSMKSTLSPIGLLALQIYREDPEAVILVLPSDHIIKGNDKFRSALRSAISAAKKDDYLVTFGIRPKRAETGYGYIKIKSKIKNQKSKIYKVEKFIEKPNLEKAKTFIRSKDYFWNSGMFIFRAALVINEIRKYQPAMCRILSQLQKRRFLDSLWNRLPSISIDYGVMEKTDKATVLPVDFEWSDFGSWQALADVLKKDKNNNILVGKTVSLDSINTFIWSDTDNKIVAAVGLKDMIVVNTKDAMLICSKGKAQDVKRVVNEIKRKGI